VLDVGVMSNIDLSFISPGDDFALGTARSYDIRYALRRQELSVVNFENAAQVKPEAVAEGSLDPVEGGETFRVRLSAFDMELEGEFEGQNLIGRQVFFAARAVDDKGIKGAVSNVEGSMVRNLALNIVEIIRFLRSRTLTRRMRPETSP